ncbi:MAG: phosphoribosylglycinamide formyltransferase [Leptospira sp.]|nr:phosphoribosylglycinamide formyltransferase [Leptospira sp.]NCS93863.1 phosphoribosylglycinamide formyltransferase [Leptospira sp.]
MASLFAKKSKKRVIFLASGRGSNFEAAAKKIRKGNLSCDPVALIVDKPEAKAILIAKSLQIPSFVVDFKNFADKNEFNKSLLEKVRSLNPDLIVTAGFMRILSKEFVQEFRMKILNIHPSLLPAFPGINSQKQAIEYGAKVSGCTVHFVDEGVDTGPVLMQSPVKIEEGMTEEELSRKILKEEHKILPQAIQLFIQNKIQITGRKVRIIS